jgi:hypothetical protein
MRFRAAAREPPKPPMQSPNALDVGPTNAPGAGIKALTQS